MTPPRKDGAPKTIRNCRDVIDLLTEYVEGGLAPGDARRLEAHLAGCGPCIEFLETLKKTRAAVGTLRAQAMPEQCRRELRAFLKKEMKKRGSGGAAGSRGF